MIALRALSLVALLLCGGAAAFADDVNRIVLRVNDRIATLYEFQQRRLSRMREIQRANLPPERQQRLLAEVGVQTMREMYEELLVLSRADQLDVRVTEAQVEAAVEDTKRSFNFESQEQFLAALASSGMTLDDLRQQMRRNLMIREVMGREVQSKIAIEEEDLRRYYRNHPDEFTTRRRLRVREVVVTGGAEEAAEARAALVAGEEGAARLAELSAAGRLRGPLELGWVERGDLEPALELAIWELEAGAVSEPIAARGGLHVVEILEEEPARLKEFSEVEEEIAVKLRNERFQGRMADFLDELVSRSYIVSNPPPEAAGFQAVEVSAAEAGDPPMLAPGGAAAAGAASAAEAGPESEEEAEPEPPR